MLRSHQKVLQRKQSPQQRLADAVAVCVPEHLPKSADTIPRVACTEPALIALAADRRYAWCTCGLSATQPFCDGSHAGTSWKPLLFTPARSQLDWICTCKFTRQPPYCDAAHNRLPQHYQRYVKEMSVPDVKSDWLSGLPADHAGPCVVLIHGLLAGEHMQRHLLRWVREAGFADANLFSNHCPPKQVADFLAAAAAQGRPVALIGYSQGGFQVLKVARELARRGVPVDLVASLATGGAGRLYPAQWGFRARRLPSNIKHLLNIYSHADIMGTDPWPRGNAVQAPVVMCLKNIALAKSAKVDHIALVRCYPSDRVHPAVAEQVLMPLLAALKALA